MFPTCFSLVKTLVQNGAGGASAAKPPASSTLIIVCRQNYAFLLCFKCQILVVVKKLPAIWHGAGAYPGVFIPEIQY